MRVAIIWTNALKKFLFTLGLLYLVLAPLRSLALEPADVQIISRESYAPKEFTLTNDDWRWLGKKRVLTMAVWQPEIPPLSLFPEDGRLEGMIADYIALLGEYLAVRIHVVAFEDRDSAYAALAQKKVDIVVDPSAKVRGVNAALVASANFIRDHPVLVHRKQSPEKPFHYQPGMRLAIARWYVDDSWIEAHFPGARLIHFDTDDRAMASVAFGENDFYIGNLVTGSYLLERHYPHFLVLQQVYPERDTGSHFVMRKEDHALIRSVGRVLDSIPRTQKEVILQQWSEGSSRWRVREQVAFTAAEKKWLADNPTVPVSVNALYAPFTMIDAKGNFYGVTADILRLVRLRTGLHFDPVPADSIRRMEDQIAGKKALFMGAVSQSEERTKQLRFSRPYFTSPFVWVEASDKHYTAALPPGTRVAIVTKNALIPELRRTRPGIVLIETENAAIAMQNVADGKADVAIHTLFGASYMIDRYFRDRLKIGGHIGELTAKVAFAVSRDQPELLSILNKSLENISPADITHVIDKWQTRPDVRLNTWELYRTRFWLVSGVAGIVILTSLIWIYYLRREIGARQLAQQDLQSQLAYNETLTRALSEETERAEQANRAKSTFLATMSHEIRTPVSAIIGLLELTVNAADKTWEDDDPVRVACESARSLMGLIGDILDMARIESGRLELTPQWVRTADLLPPVVRVFEGLARQKALRLQYVVPPELPEEIFLDPLRFRQVLSNLVSNAIKFTEKGCITVEMTLFNGETAPANYLLHISVSDTGRGISAEEQKNIFDPWVQARDGAVQSGSGLGLAICAQLVTMMGGSITIASEKGKGTQVSFTVSVQQRDNPVSPTEADVEPIAVPHRPLSILAVDDHPANRMLLRRQLMHLGHHVKEAQNGLEAWELFQETRFDVVITDCSMPGMDGLALTRLLRERAGDALIILGLTANAWPEERARCLAAGMDDCLFKPLPMSQLKTLLNDVMKNIAAPRGEAVSLSRVVDYPKLEALSSFDEQMLGELLRVTVQTNNDDLRYAADLVELQDWPELAACMHRLSGAAKICGARRIERASRELEMACLCPEQALEHLHALWSALCDAVEEFNLAVGGWLAEVES